MKKAQWLILLFAFAVIGLLFTFGKTTKKAPPKSIAETATPLINSDTIINLSKRQLNPKQSQSLATIESSVIRGDINTQNLTKYHRLAHFWKDSAGFLLPYLIYEAEAAKLENSEKKLTFAAHFFLENMQHEENITLKTWEATQAKQLFERAIKLNPANDSTKIGLGSTLLLGGISQNPMQGLALIKGVEAKDSTNMFAQMVLAKGAILSNQTDKAIARLEKIIRLSPRNIEAIMMLADINERNGNKEAAIKWYSQSLKHINRADIKHEVEKRIETLKGK